MSGPGGVDGDAAAPVPHAPAALAAPTPADPAPVAPAAPQARRRRWPFVVLAILGVVVAVPVAGLFLLGRVNLGAFAAARATAALGRDVTIGSLRVTPGRWVTVEIRDAALANPPGASEPGMARAALIRAEVDPLSLLGVQPVLRGVEVEGLRLLLERAGERGANWRFGAGAPAARPVAVAPGPPTSVPSPAPVEPSVAFPGAPSAASSAEPEQAGPAPAVAPAGARARAPTILGARLRDAEIRVRATSGRILTLRADTASLEAADPEAPVTLRAEGAYGAVPLTLEADLESFDALRDAARPYGTDLRFASGEARLRFSGTMTAPLDFDGASGLLTLEAPAPSVLGSLLGMERDLGIALDVAGPFERSGDLWRLTGGEGVLDGEPFTAPLLQITEGARGRPDAVVLDLDFARLDLNPILADLGEGEDGERRGAEADMPLAPDPAQDPTIQARIAVGEFRYHRIVAAEARIAGTVGPGRIAVQELALTAYGARITARGAVEAAGRGARVTADAAFDGADLDALRRAFGARPIPISGRVGGRVAMEGSGASLNAVARGAHVSAVLSMRGGSVARDVIETASLDVRRAFRRPTGAVAVTCLVAVAEVRARAGVIAPLRFRTAAGTIVGGGRFDLRRESLDVTVGTESATTGSLALDIPIRISGAFADPSVAPARESAEARAAQVPQLPPGLLAYARANPCFGATAGGAPRRR